MKLSNFLALNYFEQAEIIWAGNFINKIQEDGSTKTLFHIEDFFVEVTYQEAASIVTFRPVSRTEELVKYVENIDLLLDGD